MIHFGQPANSWYIWIVDEDEEFIVANRQIFHHKMPQMNFEEIDYSHRIHKLPHATVARGKRVYGSGEVLSEGGKIKLYNSVSGHYVDLDNVSDFNNQGTEVFLLLAHKVGWAQVQGGARFEIKK